MSHVTAGVQSSGRRHHRDSQLAEAEHSACGEQKNLAHADQATRATGYRAEAAAAIVEQIGVGDALRQAGAAPERWPEPPRAGQIDCEFGCACPLIDRHDRCHEGTTRGACVLDPEATHCSEHV